IIYMSRKGKTYTTLEHLTPHLLSIMDVGQILDGEIYIHGMNFQNIVRLVKKERPESKNLEYHVYDIANDKKKFTDRFIDLVMMLDGTNKNIVCVETNSIGSENDVYTYHDKFVHQGYEGIII